MKWLMVLAVTILHNENSFPPKTYELRAYTSFGHCSQAKADIDYITTEPSTETANGLKKIIHQRWIRVFNLSKKICPHFELEELILICWT